MPPAHFLNAPTYRRRHHGGSGAHRRRDRGDHQKLLISLLILCKTEDVSTSSVLFYCQTLSLRASPQTGVAIRIPSLSPSVGVGVPDDPHAQPPCHAVGATLAVARRTFKPCHCEPVRTLVWQSVPPRISCIFLRRAGFPHPAADKHSTPQTLSLRAHSAVAIRPPFFVALRRGRCPHRPARPAPHSPPQKYRAPVSPPTRDPYFFHPA